MVEEKEIKTEKKEAKAVPVIELTEVVTGTAPAIKLPTGEVISAEAYLVWLGNKILKIEKAVA